ncbi:hypothetical protein Ndes2526B_g04891 [Nannochloris sp. 'desiccata']
MMALVTIFLRALGYPEIDDFIISDPKKYQAVVVWLEHTKIRHYPLDGRQHLQAAETATWQTAFEKYLVDLACPVAWDNGETNAPVLQWLLNYAVGLEFSDKASQHNTALDEAVASAPAPQDWAPPPLPPYSDATSSETLAALEPIFNLLHLPLEPNNKITIESGAENAAVTADQIRKIKAVLEAQVLPCLAASRIPGGSGNSTPSAATVLSDFPLGFSTGDQGVDIAAMVLRMLYIKNMRELQDQVDAAIVKVQEITAEPTTDATMRRDGRGVERKNK